MDSITQYIITNFGLIGIAIIIAFFILKEILLSRMEKLKKEQDELTELRKSIRDKEMQALKDYMANVEQSLLKHISRHVEFEKSICAKIDRIYERLNPLGDSVSKILGYMEAQNGKGK